MGHLEGLQTSNYMILFNNLSCHDLFRLLRKNCDWEKKNEKVKKWEKQNRNMSRVTRRIFLKTAVAAASIRAFGKYFLGRVTEPMKGGILGTPGEEVKDIPVASDVDAHSQCRMRVNAKGGKIVEVSGDPTDPEDKGI